MPGYGCGCEQPKKMTVLPSEIWVRRIFQHSQVGRRAVAKGGGRRRRPSVHPSVPPSLCYDSPGRKALAEIFIEFAEGIVMEAHDLPMHSTLGKAYEIKCDAITNIFENTLGTSTCLLPNFTWVRTHTLGTLNCC